MALFGRSGRTRKRMLAAVVTAGTLGAFQAVALIGAPAAMATGTCTFNPGNGQINITIDPGTVSTLSVDDGSVVSAGDILFDNVPCGSATNSNTTSITVLGSPGTSETFDVDAGTLDVDFNPAIVWAVDLGTGTDTFQFEASTDGISLVLTDGTFTYNTAAAGPALGVEAYVVDGNTGDDTVDGSALTGATVTFDGGAGDDWFAPGITTDGDSFTGGAGFDTVSYGTASASQSIAIDDSIIAGAGLDANGDGDATDVGDATDSLFDCIEVLESGAGNDTLSSCDGFAETFVPGDGDDDITGGVGDSDLLDYSSSSAAMSIDAGAGTATGQGSDTFTDVTDFLGSDFNDTLVWDGSVTGFAGAAGVDTVDASAQTSGVAIDLDDLDDLAGTNAEDLQVDTTENAIGGSGNDLLDGNDIRNNLQGGDGDDELNGFAGNDTLQGGNGNDTYSGGTGADKLSFKNSANGVTVDASLGFATGEGDDSLASDIEIVVGSGHNDNITGGGGATTSNFRFQGRGGNDVLTGSGSNDTLLGGSGKDTLRGAAGDDTLKGGGGNDKLFGSQGVDVGRGGPGKDVCKGVEIKSSCSKKGSKAAPAAGGVAAKLA